jgi:N-acetylmuramic acid 6-phosphate etherase
MDMLKTEMRNPKTTHLDRMTTTEMLRVIQDENMNAVKAVDGCLDAVGRAVDAVTEALRRGGRLIYVGAGTSGRLGVLDASEACPTFGVPEGTILGVMAGGVEALYRAGEPEEDSAAFGERSPGSDNTPPPPHERPSGSPGPQSDVLPS